MAREKIDEKRKSNCSAANPPLDDVTMTSDVDSHSKRNIAATSNDVNDPKAPYSEMEPGDAGFDEFVIFLESNADFNEGNLPFRSDALRSGALEDAGKEYWMENNDDNAIHAEQYVEKKSEAGNKRPLRNYATCDTTETEPYLQITPEDVAAFQSPLLNHDELADSLKDPTTPSKSSDKLTISYEDAVALISAIEENVKKDSQIETEDPRRNYNSLNDRGRRAVACASDQVSLDASVQAVNKGCFDMVWKWFMERSCWRKIKEKSNDGMAALATIV